MTDLILFDLFDIVSQFVTNDETKIRSQREFKSSVENFDICLFFFVSASPFFPVTFTLLHHGIVQVVFLFSGDLS